MKPPSRLVIGVGVLLAMAACNEAAAPPQVAPAAPPRAVPAAEAVRDGAAAIAWVRTKAGDLHSVWLESKAGAPVARLERGEPAVATSAGLWALRWRETPTTVCLGCNCPPSACSHGVVPSLEAVLLGSGKRVVLASPGATADDCGSMSDRVAKMDELSLVGTFVFFSLAERWTQCGSSHGSYDDHDRTFDLERGSARPLAPPLGAAVDLARRARAQILADKDKATCVDQPASKAEAYSTRGTYDARGKLHGAYTYVMQSAYSCGTGPNHYTVATQLEGPPPDDLARWSSAPAWMGAYLASHPIVGLSSIPPGVDPVTAFEQFSALAKDSPKQPGAEAFDQ